MRKLLALAALLGAAAAAPAQLQPGDYVIVDFNQDTLWRVTPAGSVSALHTGAPFQGPSSAAFTPDGDLLVADYNSNSIWERPAGGGPWTKLADVQSPIRIDVDRDGSVLVPSLTTPALLRVSPTGQVSTIHRGAPLQRPFDVAVDDDGSYLLVDDRARALFRVTPGGVVSTLVQGSGLRLPQGVALFTNGDYAVIDGVVDALFRVPRGGGTPQIVIQVPVLGNPEGLIGDFEGRMVIVESGAPNGARLVEIDRFGNLRVIAAGAPMFGNDDVARVPHLTGPVEAVPLQTTSLSLSFPGFAGSPYVAYASLSLYPGFARPGGARATPVNPDGVFFFSAGANNTLFTGWGGTLDRNGRAQPGVFLLPFVPSLQLTMQAVAVDFAAPAGVGAFSNLHPLRL